jgi:hypothetical protein
MIDPGIVRLARVEHSSKADGSMLVIPPGNRIDTRALQLRKAEAPIDRTLSGSHMEAREPQ